MLVALGGISTVGFLSYRKDQEVGPKSALLELRRALGLVPGRSFGGRTLLPPTSPRLTAPSPRIVESELEMVPNAAIVSGFWGLT